jgi:glucosamine--fructose-6-phosphate aminotransferase (isomerizing)
MCGIYGYMGEKDATKVVFNGLKRLDYRGYDSWGLGVKDRLELKCDKHAGKIAEAKVRLPQSSIAIGHTRWATHGAVNDTNAHPHFASDRSFMLAHNGIVENYQQLKSQLLKKKHSFRTETDTEVIVRLIEEENKRASNLVLAARRAFRQLSGRNTIIILTQKGRIIGVRNGSPLVVGADSDLKEIYLSSDTLSFAPWVEKVLVLDNGQMIVCQPGKMELKAIVNGRKSVLRWEKNSIKDTKAGKQGHQHYMIKEINEAPVVIERVVRQEFKHYSQLAEAIKQSRQVYTIGSGTAGAAAAQIAFYLRRWAKIPALSLIGAESREYYDLFKQGDLIIAPSQSGETADVLEVLEIAQDKGVKIASYVNMLGSMMTRMSDYKFMAQAGPEICVMSTKIFVSQLAWGYLVAKTAAGKYSQGVKNLNQLALAMRRYLDDKKAINKIKRLAKKLAQVKDIYLLSRAQNLQIIREGMIKIIEGAYIHAHAVPAGDLKHYAITLIEKGVPVIAVLANDFVKNDVINAINEVKARGAEVIAISPDKYDKFDYFIKVPDTQETSAIMNIIPLQLLAYYMAVERGNNVDKPRNIAKSVTVK